MHSKLWIITIKLKKLFFISNQMYDVFGKCVKWPKMAWIHWICIVITCVSLKSLTPTQYTIAPRDLARSACWRNKVLNLLLPENCRCVSASNSVLLLKQFRKLRVSVKFLPLAVHHWAGVPAVLHLLMQWSRWLCLEEHTWMFQSNS